MTDSAEAARLEAERLAQQVAQQLAEIEAQRERDRQDAARANGG